MATVYGVNATKNNASSHQNMVSPDEQGGRVRWVHDSYECAATPSGTDIVLGGQIPAGSQIVPALSILYHDALGSINLVVGTSAAGVDLSASESVSAAGNLVLNDTVDLFGTKTTSKVNVHVTPDGSATGTIRLSLAYVKA